MQAYDRAVLRMKGADAATNFPASMYGDLDTSDPSAPLLPADASCTISLPGAAVTLFHDDTQSSTARQIRPLAWCWRALERRPLPHTGCPAICALDAPAVLLTVRAPSAHGGSLWSFHHADAVLQTLASRARATTLRRLAPATRLCRSSKAELALNPHL